VEKLGVYIPSCATTRQILRLTMNSPGTQDDCVAALLAALHSSLFRLGHWELSEDEKATHMVLSVWLLHALRDVLEVKNG